MRIAVLPRVDTITQAINLDVRRQLTMGLDVRLAFMRPDASVPGGATLIREYTTGFCRDVGDEVELRQGQTVEFEIADQSVTGKYPAGQLAADIQAAKMVRLTIVDPDDGPIESWYTIDSVPGVTPFEAQVYVITCKTRTFMKSFTRP